MKTTTQTQIAEKAGISPFTVSNILAGRRGVSWTLAGRLAETYPETSREQWMDQPQETMSKLLNSD